MKLCKSLPPLRIAALSVAVLLAGCSAVPVDRSQPQPQLPAAFSAGGERELPAQWWTAFGDPALGPLVEQALADNFSLRSAWARLSQARALARRQGAALMPTVDATANASRQWNDGRRSDGQELGLAAGYEVDLWGRLRAARDAGELDALATAADLQTAAISLSANVATTWYQVVEQRAQLSLLEHQVTTNRQLLSLVESRFRAGLAAASDVHRQRQLLEQTLGDRARTSSRLAVLTHQLAVLLGALPQQLALPAADTLPDLPPLPATGLPAALIQRRPDLKSALLRLHAADANAAVAVAERYPKLNLAATLSTVGPGPGLFADWLSGISAQLIGPLVDGGRRRAEVARTAAVVEERLNDYGQALLEALAEVEDALAQEAGQRAFLSRLEAQLAQARQVVERERLRYFQGDSDYLSVLDALRNLQGLEQQLLAARGELVTQRISLVRALAGGWEMVPPARRPSTETGNTQ